MLFSNDGATREFPRASPAAKKHRKRFHDIYSISKLTLNQTIMSFLDLVSHRRSVRSYLSRRIEAPTLDHVMECVRLAPSACNYQPWKFLIVQSDEARAKLLGSVPQEWLRKCGAPVFVIACGDRTASWKRSFDGGDSLEIDLAIAFEHLCLAAAEQQLGTCWVCYFDPAELSRTFDLPAELVPVAITPLGYPADGDETKRTPRKAMNDIVSKI